MADSGHDLAQLTAQLQALTERVLRERYPDVAPKLIQECDARVDEA
jgi:hypothetical protein